MRQLFMVSAISLLTSFAARAEDSTTNPLAGYLLTDDQIAAKCRTSIQLGVNVVDGKCLCVRIYEDMRADAQKYNDALAAEARAIASGELSSACEKDPNQQNCISTGGKVGASYLEAHQHMVSLVADVQGDLQQLIDTPTGVTDGNGPVVGVNNVQEQGDPPVGENPHGARSPSGDVGPTGGSNGR